MTWMQRRALAMIEAYQRAFEGRPSPCRFYPTCSSYAHEAFEVHGTGRGLYLTTRRLLRCRPLGPSGFDPVPEPGDRRRAGSTGDGRDRSSSDSKRAESPQSRNRQKDH